MTIKQIKHGYKLLSKNTKNHGTYNAKDDEEEEEQERDVQFYKHKDKGT